MCYQIDLAIRVKLGVIQAAMKKIILFVVCVLMHMLHNVTRHRTETDWLIVFHVLLSYLF